MRRAPMKHLALLLLLASLAACDTDGAEAARYPGVLYQNDPLTETITAPDTVVAGQSFVATVRTVGGGCERLGDTTTRVTGRVAEITPTDFSTSGPDGACATILRVFEHQAEVVFAESGTAVIRAIGASVTAPNDETVIVDRVEVERHVAVLPAR